MGLLDFFRKKDETIVKLDTDALVSELTQMGLNEENAAKVAEKIHTQLSTKVQEKRELSYDEFVNEFMSTLEAELYALPTYRVDICSDLQQFISETPEAHNSVKIYASYVNFGASEVNLDDYKVVLSGPDTNEVRAAEKKLKRWERATKIRRQLWPAILDVIKFEDGFLEKVRDDQGNIVKFNYLPSETIEIKYGRDGRPEAYYQIIDENISPSGLYKPTNLSRWLSEKKVIEFQPDEILHLNAGNVVGIKHNPLTSLVVVWRFMRLFEQALLIHRVTRARRFIIFFLDVTGKEKKEITEMVKNFTRRLKSIFRMRIDRGEEISQRSVIKTGADLVIPIVKDSATRVQTIPSDPSATKLDDLKFYVNRILTNLLTSHIFGTEKTGKEQYVEKAFFRLVRIYQKHIAYALEDLYTEVLKKWGYSNVVVSIQFPNPDPNAETRVVETIVRRMMIVNQMVAALGIAPPTAWVVEYVFKDLSQFEVERLIKMIEFEQKKQKSLMQGEEAPSLFTEEVPEAQSSPIDTLFADMEEGGETREFGQEETAQEPEEDEAESKIEIFPTSAVEPGKEELFSNLFRESRANESIKVTELLLRYLELKKGEEA